MMKCQCGKNLIAIRYLPEEFMSEIGCTEHYEARQGRSQRVLVDNEATVGHTIMKIFDPKRELFAVHNK